MLKAGTIGDFNNSMASAIEEEFERLWESRYGNELPETTKEDRRLFFLAIAQGVIKHLRDNAEDAFDVSVMVKQNIDSGKFIQSKGETTQSGFRYPVKVDQTQSRDDGSENLVISEGKGIVNILTG
jgi:hypothetical protein